MGASRGIGATTIATYLLATYGAFGVVACALFGVGVGLAVERGQGWLLVKRASPMPPLAYIVAKVVTSMTFAAVVVVLLTAVGVAFGGVRIAPLTWLELSIALVLGTIRSARSAWRSDPSRGRTPRRRSSTSSTCRCRFCRACGFRSRRCRRRSPTSRRCCRPITWASSRSARSTPATVRRCSHIAGLALWTVAGAAAAAYGLKRDEGRTYG